MTHPESILPKKLNLGSGKSFKPDHLNVDINAMWRPDICADMSMADLFGREFESERFGSFRIPAGHFDEIRRQRDPQPDA